MDIDIPEDIPVLIDIPEEILLNFDACAQSVRDCPWWCDIPYMAFEIADINTHCIYSNSYFYFFILMK